MSSRKNIPDENDIIMMLELERELSNENQVSALTLEQRRGKEVLLRNMKSHFDMPAAANDKLARQFDPDYKANPDYDYGITSEERARRDEARRHVINWSKLDRS